MKKLFKNKKTWAVGGVVLLLLVGVTAFYLYRNNSKKKEADNSAATQEAGKSNEDKGDATADATNSEKDYQTVGGETPTVTTTVGTLSEVSLTVYLATEASTSQDGKTTIPAGSITPYFYLPSGVYSVQKLTGGVWKDVATNIQYPGHGGLAAGYTTATEDNISYRTLKIENNIVKSISKTFVVKRSDLSSGSKTYN
jgi:hypothetical protein